MELREWQYINKPMGASQASTPASTTASGYKKRFEKLIKYHIDHASSELESITTKDIKPYGFHLSEHYNTGSSEFDRTIIVSVNKYTDEFYLSIFVDGKVVYQNDYEGYEKVLEILTGSYMFLPDEGTSDYDDLLTESLNEWKVMNPSANNSSQPITKAFDNTYRYQRLLAQIDNDGIATYKVNKLDNVELDITVDTANQKGLHLNIFDNVPDNPNAEDYSFTVGNKASGGWKYDEEILPMLIAGRVMKNDDLCESAGSIADDFRLYDILWEDVDVEEYNMVLGRTQYNLYNDSDLDAYLTQSARLMRKPVGNEKPLEFFKLQKINKMLRTPKYSNEKKLAAKLQKVKAKLKKSLN